MTKVKCYVSVQVMYLLDMGGLRIKPLKVAAVHVPPNTDLALSYIQEFTKCSCLTLKRYDDVFCTSSAHHTLTIR